MALSQNGSYSFDGIDVARFSSGKETPFYLISERKLRTALARFVSSIDVARKSVYYSLKTNYEMPVLKTMNALGAGVEVYRKAELEIGLAAGFTGDRMIMNGPCKNRDDLEAALENGVSLINTESWEEIVLLDELARAENTVQPIGVRVDLSIREYPSIFNRVVLGRFKPFGFHRSELPELFEKIHERQNVRLICISAHMSTPVVSPEFFAKRVDLLFRAADLARRKRHAVDNLDLGGGYPAEGVVRMSLPTALAKLPIVSFFTRASRGGIVSSAGRAITAAWEKNSRKFGFAPELMTEPGRVIADDAMIAVGRVQLVREDTVLMDISSVTEVNFQPGFSPRRLVVANKQGMSPRHAYGFYGPTMMPADKIAFLDAHYPRLEKGDVVVIENVGAYCTCHSKPWMRPRCAIYFLDRDSRIHLSRRRESFRDMIATQCY